MGNSNTEAAARSLLSFITVCTGNRILPYTGKEKWKTENAYVGFDVKSLMEPSYTLVWTDYNDNLDNYLDLIHECLASKSQEKLWGKDR